MKIRNKKTGEIRETADVIIENLKKNGTTLNAINIDEIRNEWEDYEEPKGYYYVTTTGLTKYDDTPFCAIHKDRKEIGNYFETKEEAELAVRKLKAWKRLKDKGFRFTGITPNRRYIKYNYGEILSKHGICYDKAIQFEDDLDFLFGGEEWVRLIR